MPRPCAAAKLAAVTRPELSELDHLREIERLAGVVAGAASAEGRLSYRPEADDATPLQRAVNALARGFATTTSPGTAASTMRRIAPS